MSLFLTEQERSRIADLRKTSAVANGLFWALQNRVGRRAASPDLRDEGTGTEWWYHVAEYLSDAAMAFAFSRSQLLASWLRSITLAIVRRPVDDWVGPVYRDHSGDRPRGHLETAHLGWGVALVLDLAAEVFSDAEREEVAEALREKGMALCLRWLEDAPVLSNWRCVLNAGVALPAIVLGDDSALEKVRAECELGLDVFQPDGSYSESLQYGNYAAYAQMLIWESFQRGGQSVPSFLPYAKMPRWQAASFLYRKPLAGWGGYPMARCVNFNDSAAVFRPSADLLLHIASRAREELPIEAGLARWLFEALYTPIINQGPHDLATFGLLNDFGFLSLSLLTEAAAPISPEEAGLPELMAFDCGDVIARKSWKGRTVLAARTGGRSLHGPGHLHGDLNSFILVHNEERLLADPGHSCYRNLIRGLDVSTRTHNTCTFTIGDQVLEQGTAWRRRWNPATREIESPVDRGGRLLLQDSLDDITVIGSDAAAVYGEPISIFRRYWFLCGEHVVFILDRIEATQPIRTTWNWLLNNRDGQLEAKVFLPDRIVARRGDAGMKLFHLGGAKFQGPDYAHIHDAYHPSPNQMSEGKLGSGLLYHWTETQPAKERSVIHAIAMDHYGTAASWHLKESDATSVRLEAPYAGSVWDFKTFADGREVLVEESVSGRKYSLSLDREGRGKLQRE